MNALAAKIDNQTRRDQLINDYWHLVKQVVDSWCRKYPVRQSSRDDLESDAALGLMKAADCWDSERCPFEPWARLTIKRQIIDQLRLREGRRDLAHQPRWQFMQAMREALPINAMRDSEKHNSRELDFQGVIAGEEPAEIDHEFWEQIGNHLTEQMRQVIVQYYRDGLPLHEIGTKLGFSESRASQLRKQGIERLLDYFSFGIWLAPEKEPAI